MEPKHVLIVTSRISVYNDLRPMVTQAAGERPEMGLDEKSTHVCLAAKVPFDIIVWDQLKDEHKEVQLENFIKLAKEKFPNAIMMTVAPIPAIRAAHLRAGCTV